jgi:hypothetical protein
MDVRENNTIEHIIDILIRHMGIVSAEHRSYTLVLHDAELPNSITVEEAIHKFGLKEGDNLTLWARVIGGV